MKFRGLVFVSGLALLYSGARAQDGKVFINEKWPIVDPKGGSLLSPPHVEPTNECAKSVYVDSFVPHATITVYRGGTTIIGTLHSVFGFAAVPLTTALHIGDKITATQTVNGVHSAHSSPPMVVGKMPATLPAPTIDPKIYACGHVVPVHNLVSGVTVEVRDLTAGSVIGNGSTPNLWGSDWEPVGTSPLVNGHKVTARQSACTGVHSPDAAPETVQADPSPMTAPTLDTPIVGNDAITAHGLYIGSNLQAFQPPPTVIGSGYSTASDNWMHVSPPIKASPGVSPEQDLCSHGPLGPPVTPTTTIPPPVLVGPICPGQPAAIVRDSTINATLVLVKNGTTVGYGGAAPGDAPIDLIPGATFVDNDTVQVFEYIGALVAASNTIIVGCTGTETYHNDSLRTGWNHAENTLTPANVATSFGLITTVSVDDQIDTQALIVPNQTIAGQGIHTVAYVTTEGNTVYAIDSWSGTILKSRNLGHPVPTPLGCTNNGPNVGIDGTPTIDVRTKTIYVMAYTLVGGKPTYQLHALDLSTLKDKPGSPKKVTASHALTSGAANAFDASVQRQRSALLQANGNVYAAFGSFCDFEPDHSRGWLLGWKAGSLAPLAANELTNRLAQSSSTDPTKQYFLSSIWMSGYGVAADPSGALFFVTGNSDYQGNTYTGTTNIQESVVKMTPDLSSVSDLFTPSNVFPLDMADADYGSGGALVLPDQPGPKPHLAVAAGKDGRMFILDRDGMGGFHTPDVPANVGVGACWCGPSYFKGADGVGRVVSSGGVQVMTWKVNGAASPALQSEATGASIDSGQDGGFFTTVSSNGSKANTQIIWAISHPTGSDKHITLYAFNGTASGGSLTQLFSGAAGQWPNDGGNANLVPTVANGRVYVPSYKQLAIFGLKTGKHRWPPPRREAVLQIQALSPRPRREGAIYYGTIQKVEGAHVVVALRTGKTIEIDLSRALEEGTTTPALVGRNVVVQGAMTAKGVLRARTMSRAKGPKSWGPDTEK